MTPLGLSNLSLCTPARNSRRCSLCASRGTRARRCLHDIDGTLWGRGRKLTSSAVCVCVRVRLRFACAVHVIPFAKTGVLCAEHPEHDPIPNGLRADWHDRSIKDFSHVCVVLQPDRSYGVVGSIMRWQCCHKCNRCHKCKHEHEWHGGRGNRMVATSSNAKWAELASATNADASSAGNFTAPATATSSAGDAAASHGTGSGPAATKSDAAGADASIANATSTSSHSTSTAASADATGCSNAVADATDAHATAPPATSSAKSTPRSDGQEDISSSAFPVPSCTGVRRFPAQAAVQRTRAIDTSPRSHFRRNRKRAGSN